MDSQKVKSCFSA